ncbi:hypothetical protein vBLenPICBM1__3 [Lentibacter phage vB_LenP_ICBM1]|uniref:Uncharacterized protein n=1 Tax=Lentibacter phage vB_LenP_ICBM1 TaxID=2847822 RepID=A0A3G2YRK4_9CAUD|nr:hypothetical protein HWB27_gp03 [Lentibacter phage vB_LenP_ICBM1]AYP28117.1 hypothetical protein vBLenPICBM1__3 [Lentibacter phage vB_LenP_ICBM1]
MLEKVIFAIDNDKDTHALAKFLRHVDTEQVMGRFGPMQHLIGSYEGAMECSYMIDARDLPKVQRFIEYQDSVLHVPADTRQPCHLVFNRLSDQPNMMLEPMREVSHAFALKQYAWTYNLATGRYFVC